MQSVGAVFTDFNDSHITKDKPKGEVKLALGMDHGDGASFSQVCVLCAVDDSGEHEKVWVLDMYSSESTTTPDMDAESINIMLRRNGLEWSNIDYVWGDRAYPGRRSGASKKSNNDLMHAMARTLRVPQSRLRPSIKTVKRGQNRGAGSVHRGTRFIHYAMIRPGHFHIHPRCTRLIDSLKRWQMRDDEWKHAIDALRYTLQTWIFQRRRSQNHTVRLKI
jgi:hypothetical protein